MNNLIFQTEVTLLTALIIGFISLTALILWFFVYSNYRPIIGKYEGVVAPFFSLPAVLFSLTAALLATSVWDNYSIANKAIKNESQSLLNVISLSDSISSFGQTNLSAFTKAYAQSIIYDEWQTLASSRSGSPITNEKFIAMRAELFRAANLFPDKAESKALLNSFYTLNNAREMRLAYAAFDLHPIRWYALLFLGALVLTAVALIHISKPRALAAALMISTMTVLTPLCIIALTFSSPYKGVISLSSDPYLEILK